MEDITDVKAHMLMLEHVTAALWANFLANSGGDTIATCRRVAKESLDALDGVYERLGETPNPGLHPTIQAILHYEEGFWRQVEDQVRTRADRQRRQRR